MEELPEQLRAALLTVADFIHQTTGEPATWDEIAEAMTRYFVLNEIKEHVLMTRREA